MNRTKINKMLLLTERITMSDVSIVEVAHKADADKGEHKNEEFLVIRPTLLFVEERPDHVVDPENYEE